MTRTQQIRQQKWNEAGNRFRFASVCILTLGIAGWFLSFMPFDNLIDRSGTPLGGDYVMLYVAGQTMAQGQSDTLYDDAMNQSRSSTLFPSMEPTLSWPFRYPPTVATVMSPLSRLPFSLSFACFFAMQIWLLGLSVQLLRSSSSILRQHPIWVWPMIGAPLIVETSIGGQSSMLGLCCVSSYIVLAKQNRNVAAGIALAVALYKPNVLLLFIIGALLMRPKTLLGFVPTVFVGVAVALLSTGPDVLVEYLTLGSRLASSTWSLETPFWKVHGLAPYFQSIFPEHGKLLTFALGIVMILMVFQRYRVGALNRSAALSLYLMINALFNPYVPVYDLVLLLPLAVLWSTAAWEERIYALRPGMAQAALGFLFLGPHLSQAMARGLGFQAFPLCLCLAAAALLWHVSNVRDEATFELGETNPTV